MALNVDGRLYTYHVQTNDARQHHDYQREGNPVGYYVPGQDPLVDRGNTLILAHKDLRRPEISDKLLVDDIIVEVDWQGHKVWEWVCSDH
ncbi:MAG: hypothetical protein LBK56_03885, partial [Gracilibacteraceae bacterium]|nr:hypothetical protein [Gracilibacteraceae bacterium]